MRFFASIFKKAPFLVLAISYLLLISILVLRSIAPFVFPIHFFYLFLGVFAFIIFSQIRFDILALFSTQFYVMSIVFLLIPLIIGQVTRGAVRWIPIGPITLQPSEIVRPFLLIFFAKFLTQEHVSIKRFIISLFLLALPLFLILIQPSLGVTALTAIGFFGVLLASSFSKKLIVLMLSIGLLVSPVALFLLAPYQKQRVITFLNPTSDPSGAGYNALQSMISVGSGKIFGRGLGQGVQTQLAFLPERHTDFIYASVAEELGFLGTLFLLAGSFFLLFEVTQIVKSGQSVVARAFASGLFLTLFIQTFVHIGMNMGMFPITGVPLPLVSAGGSSLLATLISLGILLGAKAQKSVSSLYFGNFRGKIHRL